MSCECEPCVLFRSSCARTTASVRRQRRMGGYCCRSCEFPSDRWSARCTRCGSFSVAARPARSARHVRRGTQTPATWGCRRLDGALKEIDRAIASVSAPAWARWESSTSAPRSDVDRETYARFWARTDYEVGRLLDMRAPDDRAMARIWQDIRLIVQREAGAR